MRDIYTGANGQAGTFGYIAGRKAAAEIQGIDYEPKGFHADRYLAVDTVGQGWATDAGKEE